MNKLQPLINAAKVTAKAWLISLVLLAAMVPAAKITWIYIVFLWGLIGK